MNGGLPCIDKSGKTHTNLLGQGLEIVHDIQFPELLLISLCRLYRIVWFLVLMKLVLVTLKQLSVHSYTPNGDGRTDGSLD